MSATVADAGPSAPYEIRITNHGKIKNWVSFALEHFEKYEDRPLVLHTLPGPKGKDSTDDGVEIRSGGGGGGGGAAAAAAAAAAATVAGSKNPTEKQAKGNRLHTSMGNIPRLISVVEIIKREYLKTLDPALAQAGSLSGLYQYNEVGDLEEEGYIEGMGNEEQDRMESLAYALQGQNHLKQKKIAFMRVTLCRKKTPDLARKGVTYQPPATRKLSKSTRARLRKKQKKAEGGS